MLQNVTILETVTFVNELVKRAEGVNVTKLQFFGGGVHFQLSLAREKKVIENVVVGAVKEAGINLTPPSGTVSL